MILSPLASLRTLGGQQALSLWPGSGGCEQYCPLPLFLQPSCQWVLGIAYPQPAKQVRLRKTAGLKDALGPLLRAFEPLLCWIMRVSLAYSSDPEALGMGSRTRFQSVRKVAIVVDCGPPWTARPPRFPDVSGQEWSECHPSADD